jgi:hypothetical protein
MAALDMVEHECSPEADLPGRPDIAAPARQIEGSMESIDMTFLNRDNIDGHCGHS